LLNVNAYIKVTAEDQNKWQHSPVNHRNKKRKKEERLKSAIQWKHISKHFLFCRSLALGV